MSQNWHIFGSLSVSWKMRHNFGDPPNTPKQMATVVLLLSGTRTLATELACSVYLFGDFEIGQRKGYDSMTQPLYT